MKHLQFYFAACLGVTALITAVASPLIIRFSASAAERADIVFADLPLFLFDHRAWLPLLALPGIACAIVTFARRRFSAALFVAGCLALLFLIGLTLFAFISILAPLYQYQSL